MSTHAQPTAPRRSRKLLWILLVCVAVIVLLGAVLLPLLLDPERHRERIEAGLREATGWDAELGQIDFSVWRGMVLTVSPAGLSAPDAASGFDIDTIAIRARLWPLLRGRLDVERIELIQPRITLVRPSEERGWVLPMGAGSAGEDPGTAGRGSGLRVSIDEVQVREGSLELRDEASAPPWSVVVERTDITLRPVEGEMHGSGELAGGGTLDWDGRLEEGLVLRVAGVKTERLHTWLGEGLVRKGGELTGEFRFRLPLAVEGSLTGTGLRLLAGERPLEQAELEFEVAPREGSWWLDRFDLTTSGARVGGGGTLFPALDLDLTLQETPLETALTISDAVLPLPLDVSPPGAVEARLAVDRPQGGKLTYSARGRLSAARFKPGDKLPTADDVVADFELDRKGALEIRIVEGSMGGGPIEGTARMESIQPPGTLRFDGGLSQASLGRLLGGMVPGADEGIAGPTTARVGVGLDLGGDGFDLGDLNGRLQVEATDVNLPGWDLEAAILGGIHEQLGPLSQLAGLFDADLAARLDASQEQGRGSTKLLDRMNLDVDFDNWPWRLNDLRLRSGDVAALGEGSFDPADGSVSLVFEARLDKQRTAELVEKNSQLRYLVDDQGRLAVPLGVGGTLMSPSFNVDVEDLLLRQLGGEDAGSALKGLLEGLLGKDEDD